MINDVARAVFEAKATRDVCVELPEEDISPEDRRRDMVGHLVMSLYGTRDAAMNWQEEVARVMRSWGFTRGKYNPCLCMHKELGVDTLVHGGDFVTTGHREEVRKFKTWLENSFEIKMKVIGSGRDEVRESEF